MRTRRNLLSALSAGALALLSGCLSFISGRAPLVFAASDVSVTEAARDATGFDRTRAEFVTIQREVTIAGQTRTIKIRNYIAEFKRQINLVVLQGELARFTVFATPNVEIAGQALNPITHLSTEQLVERLQEKYSRIDNIRKVGTRHVPVLGTTATVTKYAGTATVSGGQEIDVYVHLTKVHDGEDTIIAVGIHPRQLNFTAEVDRMLRGIQH